MVAPGRSLAAGPAQGNRAGILATAPLPQRRMPPTPQRSALRDADPRSSPEEAPLRFRTPPLAAGSLRHAGLPEPGRHALRGPAARHLARRRVLLPRPLDPAADRARSRARSAPGRGPAPDPRVGVRA